MCGGDGHPGEPRQVLSLLPVQLHSFVLWVHVGDWIEVGYGTKQTEWRMGQIYEIGTTGADCTVVRARDHAGVFSVNALHAEVVSVRKLSAAESVGAGDGPVAHEGLRHAQPPVARSHRRP
jgi:hypothetical protein